MSDFELGIVVGILGALSVYLGKEQSGVLGYALAIVCLVCLVILGVLVFISIV